MTVDDHPASSTFDPLAGGSLPEVRAGLRLAPDAVWRDVGSPMFCGPQRVDVVW